MAKAKAKRNTKKITIATFTYFLLFAGAGAGITNRTLDKKQCGGTERWDVKIGTDKMAGDIDTVPIITTIDSLDGIKTSKYQIKMHTERQNIEKQVYTIKNCFISEVFREADRDYHLVIEDGHKHHMIAEIPNTDCARALKSRFIHRFKTARSTFIQYQETYDHHRFDITGVLFIDKKHPKPPEGNNLNNVELHPVLDLKEVSQF